MTESTLFAETGATRSTQKRIYLNHGSRTRTIRKIKLTRSLILKTGIKMDTGRLFIKLQSKLLKNSIPFLLPNSSQASIQRFCSISYFCCVNCFKLFQILQIYSNGGLHKKKKKKNKKNKKELKQD